MSEGQTGFEIIDEESIVAGIEDYIKEKKEAEKAKIK